MKDYAEMGGKAGDTDSHFQEPLLLISCVASFLREKAFEFLYIYIYIKHR